MRVSHTIATFGLIVPSLVNALEKNQYCVDAVYEALSSLSFEGSFADAYWEPACQNPLKVGTMYASAMKYCTDIEITAGLALLEEYCLEYGEMELLPYSEFEGNLSAEYLSSLRVINYEEIPVTENVTTVVLISEAYFDVAYRTIATWEFEEWTHHTYGFAMYGFWGAILLIGITTNAYNTFWHSRSSRNTIDPRRTQSSSSVGRLSHWAKMHYIIPTVFSSYRRRLWFTFSVPTRIEALIIVSYWSISIILCSVNFKTFEGNLYWASIPPQVWRYVADRTGIMCYANLPLIWMFSGRNNIFLWATGWDFSTFNVFHRHIARVATLEAIVHSISYTVLYKQDDYYTEELAEAWFYLGITATVSMSSLLIFSSVWLRKKFYEIFLILHIALSVLVIVSLFYHTSIFDGEYDPYLWPLVAIWSFDRLLRLVRLAYCNVRIGMSKNFLRLSSSVVTYDKAADIVKIVVTPAHTLLRPKPGQFYYIYRPIGWKGWENHPFTLGSFTRPGQLPQYPSQNMTGWNKEILISEQPITPTSASTSSMNDKHDDTPDQPQQLTFWIRPFDGWTKKLAYLCQQDAHKTANSKLLIEGPYGHSANLHNYESLLLIAGGTGISAVLPYMEEHIYRQSNTGKANMGLRTHEIDLLFTSRNPEFIHNLCGKELRPILSREDIHTSFYSTSVVHTKAHSAEADKIRVDNGQDVSVEVNFGRPDIKNAILEAARINVAGGSKAGRLAILVCGPARMADEARAAVYQAMLEGCRNIEYIEETFGW